jgi:hypothetical protein
VTGHDAAFEAWMQRYPRLLEARAFLSGVDHATGHGLDRPDVTGGEPDDGVDVTGPDAEGGAAQDPSGAEVDVREPAPVPPASARPSRAVNRPDTLELF